MFKAMYLQSVGDLRDASALKEWREKVHTLRERGVTSEREKLPERWGKSLCA